MKKLILVISVFWCGASNALGPISSGGGDFVSPSSGSAWFLGANNTINVCVDRGDDFSLAKIHLQTMIFDVFEKWKTYIETTKTEVNRVEELLISKEIEMIESCQKADLTFYFGSQPNNFASYSSNFDQPSAFAVREHYDLDAGWGKGFIWFANLEEAAEDVYPGENQIMALKTLMLHEVGHVFGMGHVNGTIMDEDILSVIKTYQDFNISARLYAIDFAKELSTCWSCTSFKKGFGTDEAISVLFERPVSGTPSIEVMQKPDFNFEFLISDNLGERVFKVTFPENLGQQLGYDFFAPQERTFHVAKNISGMIQSESNFIGVTSRKGLITLKNESVLIEVSLNMGFWGPLSMVIYDNKFQRYQLFNEFAY